MYTFDLPCKEVFIAILGLTQAVTVIAAYELVIYITFCIYLSCHNVIPELSQCL